ncbi:class I SAM-dependent methyltransferase [Sphingomonas solaris]|uniref:Methyltransferase domain-containing protein n=1 Tax=Alterirhizorhabdus solaris TaxID=2529389 RepID=A0A558R4Z7_9SPHN|nr:methyltransferase domain-containing protein [Sphingomonas solaris]TVV74465.1 methyltransferase domain-containing protein [Sphingomonas solaris]
MSALARAIGRQLREPSGFGGWLTGCAMRLANRRPTRLAIAALGIRPGDVVVDLGCGTGDAVPALLAAARGGETHGVDHSEAMVRTAAHRHPDAIFHHSIFARLPFADATIDRVLAANVAYFWTEASPILTELARVMRPDGRLAIYVTDGATLARVGLRADATRRSFRAGDLEQLLGPRALVQPVRAGPGVRGFVATIEGRWLHARWD